MSEASLFTAAEMYSGDPLRPDTETVTPVEVIAELSPDDRRNRVYALIEQAWQIIRDAGEAHRRGRTVVARCVLFSGGNDSTTLAHLFRDFATHAIHANTGIGIEQTRQFVRDTCEMWGLPLIEKHGQSYRDAVIEHGFPGPAAHRFMFIQLKEKALDAARRDLGIARSRSKCALFLAGARREESKRREDVPLFDPDGTVIWTNPLAMWTKLDLNTYRQMFDVPRNEVSDLLHMSGECLCGAYAHPGELDEIGEWFPEVRTEIEVLEAEVRAAGVAEPFCRWGHGEGLPSKSGRLCSSCDARFTAQLSLDVTGKGDAA